MAPPTPGILRRQGADSTLLEMQRETFDMAALKKKLSDMEHDHSDGCCDHDHGHDFLEDLPLSIRRRVHALEFLHSKRGAIAAEYRKELLALERKFLAKYAPLHEERAKIISGQREPTTGELAGFSGSGVEEVGKAEGAEEFKGIPQFWVTVLQNHPTISSVLTEGDMEALGSLVDIRMSYFPDKPGFKLDFEFAPNEYFTNTTLTKEYHLDDPTEGEQDDFVYDRAVGTEIQWKAGKNLCFKTVTRTQRHRSNNTTRTVKREERQESFFHFFIPPTVPEDEDSEEAEDVQDFENMLQVDYEIGEIIKDQIVPNAVDWFTGKALEYAELEDEDYYGDEEDYDDDDDEGDEDEDDEEESEEEAPRRQLSKPGPRHRAAAGAGPQEKPECKQQ